MKNIFIILLVLISFNINSQTYEYYMDKEVYDSLSNLWLKGRIYFKNGEVIEGWIHREAATNNIQRVDFTKKDLWLRTYPAEKILGFSVQLSDKDSAKYVFMDINPDPRIKDWRSMNLLVDGELSLLRYCWIVKVYRGPYYFLSGNEYVIYSDYYLYDSLSGELTKIQKYKRDFLPYIYRKKKAWEFYKKDTKKFKKNRPRSYIKLTKIYNMIDE